jgi:adenylate cyclase
MKLHAYLAQDRLRALARGEILPDRSRGSALFADISGFTQLSEALSDTLGARRGVEELTKHLDTVYSALISQIERYGGSVIGFAGDAILCWFDELNGPAAARAMACALALQETMRTSVAIVLPNGTTAALTLKVAIATGPARRFVVGDPTIQLIDALAGATIARTATADYHAQGGDVILDEATVHALGEALTIQEWRDDHDSGERFAVVTQFASDTAVPVLPASLRPPPANKLAVWVHQAVYDREQSGQGTFLNEFRPCVALFARFIGIDYDADSAQAQLDAFVCSAQSIAARFDGMLMDLTVGDKGSYAYITFGALGAHEDEARRAVRCALDLQNATSDLGFLEPLQMGITQGALRVGAYGGNTRRTYGALGDEVNLAARLMSIAAPGEILLSGHAHKAVEDHFVFEPHPPLPIKGKAEPLPVFAVAGERQQRAIRLQEPTYMLPMVGRQAELQIITGQLDLTLQGQSQIIGIVADAGMGKSRLVAEVIRLARKRGFVGYGGACQSDALNTPYQAWKSIATAFFDVDPAAPLKKQIRLLEGEIEDRAPERVEAMPLLGILLNLEIPDNDFTRTLEPQDRQSSLRVLLEDCLRAVARDEPLLIVIEDLHWIDALSHDLLEDLARALADSPICFVLAYRPPQVARLEAPRLEALPNFTRIELSELNAAEAEQAIRAKLAQLYPARRDAVPGVLVQRLMARAQGNPFFLEELLNFLRDRGLDPRDPDAWEKIELPDSLHTLILSRIDQLSEREKTTLRVASIVGRLFRADWLPGYYPELGGLNRAQADLEQLAEMDITPLHSHEPELEYLFKHIVTHEVTYESIPFATRAQLHEQLAVYLERIAAPVALIAEQYGRSANTAKQREYFRKAGDAALAAFANDAALDYFARLQPLLTEPREQVTMHLKRADILALIGQPAEAEAHYRPALALAETQDDPQGIAESLLGLGRWERSQGEYADAASHLLQSLALFETLPVGRGLAQTLVELSNVARAQGDYATERQRIEEAHQVYQDLHDTEGLAFCLQELGVNARHRGDYPAAERLLEEALQISQAHTHTSRRAYTLNLLGYLHGVRQDYALAAQMLDESIAIFREIGNQWGVASGLNQLGYVSYFRGDWASAYAAYTASLAQCRALNDRWGVAVCLNGLGWASLAQAQAQAAQSHFRQALHEAQQVPVLQVMTEAVAGLAACRARLGEPSAALPLLGLALQHHYSKQDLHVITAPYLQALRAQLGDSSAEAGLAKGAELDWDVTVQELLSG